MNRDLPPGWLLVPLSAVTEEVPNASPDDEPEREFGYVDISAIDNKTFTITASEVKRFRGNGAPSRARRPVKPDDVLFSNVRTYLRNIALVEQHCPADLCSTGFTVLRPNAAIDSRYLFRYVLTDEFLERVTPQQTGTHYPATSDRVVMAEAIAVPPLAEQRRIVAQVEALLARVRSAQDRLDKIPTLLKRFRQSVLTAACTGRLTADWRSEDGRGTDDAAPIGWQRVILGDRADLRLGKMLDQAKNVGRPTRYLRNVNLRWFSFDLNDVNAMRATSEDATEFSIRNGDLLVCEGGEPA